MMAKSFSRLERELLLDLGNGKTRVKTLGAGSRAVENSVAPVESHAIVEVLSPLGSLLVSGVGEPAVRLEEDGGAKVLLGVPPVRGARGRAAGAKHALVETVELASFFNGLAVLLAIRRGSSA